MEQLIERVNKLSFAARAGIIAGIVLGVTAALMYFVILPVRDDIEKKTVELKAAEETLAGKQAIADNLTEKRREMEKLEQELQEALTQLPEKKEIEDLLAQLNDIGKKAGLEVAKVVPGVEAAENAFISRIPIAMQVSGNYHEIAMFMQEVGGLRRIVNVGNIKLSNKAVGSDKVVLAGDFIATTFRFAEGKTAKPGVK